MFIDKYEINYLNRLVKEIIYSHNNNIVILLIELVFDNNENTNDYRLFILKITKYIIFYCKYFLDNMHIIDYSLLIRNLLYFLI